VRGSGFRFHFDGKPAHLSTADWTPLVKTDSGIFKSPRQTPKRQQAGE
jgi:hypothetical protein